jgi:hypothetical protein
MVFGPSGQFWAKGDAMPHKDYQDCIDACYDCATACDHCAASCLNESDVGELAHCIRLDLDCAIICRTAASLMSRGSEFIAEFCAMCARVCDDCADECERHSHKHCRECARACRECAEQCRKMAGQTAGA